MSDARVSIAGAVGLIHDAETYPDFDPAWLDAERWRAAGAREHSSTGRGSVMILDRGDEGWVYRHYHRGGLVARLVYDQYVWSGFEGSRAFREWRLLDYMHARGLPVPRPVAARAVRTGFVYRADIVTVLLPDTRPLSALIARSGVDAALWPRIGAMVRAFHDAGIDHPDLTAHNTLVDGAGRVFLVDFDNARHRAPGRWAAAGMARLKRSLRKVALETGAAFEEPAWASLVAGYDARA